PSPPPPQSSGSPSSGPPPSPPPPGPPPGLPPSGPPSGPPPSGLPPASVRGRADARARMLAVALFLLAGLVVDGVLSSSWMTGSGVRGNVHVGLRGVEMCRELCRTLSWSDTGRFFELPSWDVVVFAWTGFAGGLALAALAVALGWFTYEGRRFPVPPPVLYGVAGVALHGMVAFSVVVFNRFHNHADVGYSSFFAILGTAGIGVVVWLLAHPPRR
ncbi:MAG TPA: hypothetical protein VHE35_29705, partial [Kofleriaceae bacterium]|nr:hypothetical protein [Kofleriaceae bacterium]